MCAARIQKKKVRSAENGFSRSLVFPLKLRWCSDVDGIAQWEDTCLPRLRLHEEEALDSSPGTKTIRVKINECHDSLPTYWKGVYTINSLRRRLGHLLLEPGAEFS